MILDRPGRYYTWSEFTGSATAARLGIINHPGPSEQHCIARLAHRVLDPLRAARGAPIRITSGYRSPELNRAVDGSKGSDHLHGRAADIESPGLDAVELALLAWSLRLPAYQIIAYAPERGGHLHISHRSSTPPRRQLLWAPAAGGFLPWSPNPTETP